MRRQLLRQYLRDNVLGTWTSMHSNATLTEDGVKKANPAVKEMARLLSISEVNDMSIEDFQTTFRNVIEDYMEAAVRVGHKRPFASTRQLCDAFEHYLDSIPEHERVHILCLHPDLAARVGEKLTAESTSEQAAAGLNTISDEERLLIQQYNKQYKDKFGFPFIICARENKVRSIIDGLAQRYNNQRIDEITTAIDEVKKICRLRILDLVEGHSTLF